jgi:hypothetical protein
MGRIGKMGSNACCGQMSMPVETFKDFLDVVLCITSRIDISLTSLDAA